MFPTNYPDELFYWAANALMQGPAAQRALLVLALEGAFANGPIVDGDQVTFARVRIRIDGLQDGQTYTITYPYGVEMLVADGGGINMTRDIGLVAGGDFTGALHGDIGPFLVPVGFTGQSVAGSFIADGATEVAVTGSPNGTNFFRIQGPGIEAVYPANAGPVLGDDTVEIATFVLQGRVARQVKAGLDTVYYGRTTSATSVNVWASSISGQNLRVSANLGSVAAPSWGPLVQMTESAGSGTYFARLELGIANPPPQVRVSNLSDNPVSSTLSSGSTISDLVTVESAVYTIGGNLVVRAHSSDAVAPPASFTATIATTSGELQTIASIGNSGVSTFEGEVILPANATAPARVTVESPNGAGVTVPVEVVGSGSQAAPDPVIAVAGADQQKLAGDSVQLDGGGSLGPVTNYSWSPAVGAGWALSNPGLANPTFVAPIGIAGGLLDLSFTLTVTDGISSSTDTVIIHVSEPQQQPPDILTVTDARYIASKVKWRASGTASVLANQTIQLYLGSPLAPDFARPIGNALVDATGAWSYQGGNNTAAANVRPPIAGISDVWAVSTFANPGNVNGHLVFRIN